MQEEITEPEFKKYFELLLKRYLPNYLFYTILNSNLNLINTQIVTSKVVNMSIKQSHSFVQSRQKITNTSSSNVFNFKIYKNTLMKTLTLKLIDVEFEINHLIGIITYFLAETADIKVNLDEKKVCFSLNGLKCNNYIFGKIAEHNLIELDSVFAEYKYINNNNDIFNLKSKQSHLIKRTINDYDNNKENNEEESTENYSNMFQDIFEVTKKIFGVQAKNLGNVNNIKSSEYYELNNSNINDVNQMNLNYEIDNKNIIPVDYQKKQSQDEEESESEDNANVDVESEEDNDV